MFHATLFVSLPRRTKVALEQVVAAEGLESLLLLPVAGLLLLYRPTVTLGLFAATGAFLNVVMINMSYDVPVKLYASHLLLACLFLLAWDAKRLFRFLVLNRATPMNSPVASS